MSVLSSDEARLQDDYGHGGPVPEKFKFQRKASVSSWMGWNETWGHWLLCLLLCVLVFPTATVSS